MASVSKVSDSSNSRSSMWLHEAVQEKDTKKRKSGSVTGNSRRGILDPSGTSEEGPQVAKKGRFVGSASFPTINYNGARKVSDTKLKAYHEQLRIKLIREVLAEPSLAIRVKSVTSPPLKNIDQYITDIDSATTLDSQQKAIERFVNVLLEENLNTTRLHEIKIRMDSLLLTHRKLADDHMSLPVFVHINDQNNPPDCNLQSENVYMRSSALMWESNPLVASNEARLTAINAVLNWVYQNFYSFKHEKLTLVSLGSGCLLMEHLIHQELLKMGISKDKIQWRCIDPSYLNTMEADKRVFKYCQGSMRSFKKNKEECVLFYSTEQAYFERQRNDVNLSIIDKSQGPLILLSFAPYVSKNSKTLKRMRNCKTEDMLVGTIVNDCNMKEANTICFIGSNISSDVERKRLREKYKPGSYTENIDLMVKGWIDLDGTPRIDFACGYKSDVPLTGEINSYILHLFNCNQSETSPLKKLKEAFENICSLFNKHETISSITFPYSDYFVSFYKLITFLNTTTPSKQFPMVSCELLNNEVKMTKINYGS